MANCGILGFAMGMVPPVSPRAPAVDALFVYGTLLSRYVPRGERAIHAPATLRAGHKVGSGLLRKFELCDLGLYPCIVRSNAESQVVGEVYRLQRVGDWGELDEYEGISEEHQAPYEYRREVVTVEMSDGREMVVQTYVYNRDASQLKRIEGGDFIAYYNATS